MCDVRSLIACRDEPRRRSRSPRDRNIGGVTGGRGTIIDDRVLVRAMNDSYREYEG